MPCAQGTRESIEASKEYNKRQRELDRTDPVRILWRCLVERVRHSDTGYSGLSPAERRFFAVALLDAAIRNAGFDEYFAYGHSSYYDDAALGLEEMGATAARELLRRAKRIVARFQSVSAQAYERRAMPRIRSGSKAGRLYELDQLYRKDPDDLNPRIEQYLRRHGLIPDVA